MAKIFQRTHDLDDILKWLNSLTEIFTIIFISVFHILFSRQKFQNCLKRFDIIDNTLLKLGAMTDYEKLRRKVMWYALGWIVTVILIIYSTTLLLKNQYNSDIASAIYCSCLRDYCFHINLLGDLINASILELVHFLRTLTIISLFTIILL